MTVPLWSEVFAFSYIRGCVSQNKVNGISHHPLLRVESRQDLRHSLELKLKERNSWMLGL